MKNLEVEHITTEIGDKKLLIDISCSINAGSILALVGHNGAGKSTLIKTILGITPKKSGKITVKGLYDQDKDYLRFKEFISYLPEEPLLLTELTVMQHFQLYGMSYRISKSDLALRVKRYVDGFELKDKLDEYPETLSKGMRQKVQAICALLPNVPVLLIDEPFMGLDIYAMDYLEELMKEKISEGTSVLLTTHQLERVKDIADDYIMLQHGELHKHGPITDFETIRRGTDR